MKIGILGAGQLGRMLALAGYPLGHSFRFLDPQRDSPASPLGETVVAEFDDATALDRFADGIDVCSFEFENVPAASLRRIARHVAVYPPPDALEIAQDRLLEKQCFRALKIATPDFYPVDSLPELQSAIQRTGFPAVLKTRRFGYDGKGQWVLRTPDDIEAVWAEIAVSTQLILEGFVPFDRELSVIGARNVSGDIAIYPLTENRHEGGILRLSQSPAQSVSESIQRDAEAVMIALLERLDYVGVLALELFQRGDDLLANEMAPRVHNSGHWTIEGAEVSQFENHIRAISGLPVTGAEARGYCAMWNILGQPPPLPDLLRLPSTHVHLYDKPPRPGRKIGHVTVVTHCEQMLRSTVEQLQTIAPQT